MLIFIASLQNQALHAQNNSIKMTNPLLQKSALQYQAPPCNLIKDENFKHAFEYALKRQIKEPRK